MREQEIEVTNKSGNLVRATLLIPDTIPEMTSIMGERFVLRTMIAAYVHREKRRLISGWKPREKVLKFRESSLTPGQRDALISAGLLVND